MAEKSRSFAARKLLIGFIFVILIFIAFGIISLFEMRTISKVTRTLYDHSLVVSNASLHATLSITKMHRSLKDVVLRDSPLAINMAINTVNEQGRLVYKYLDMVKNNILGDEGQKLEIETRQMLVDCKPICDEIIKLVRKGQREEAAKITMGNWPGHVAKVENKMFELNSYARNKATDFMQHGEKVRSRVEKATIIFMSIGVFLSIFIALFTVRRTHAAEEALRESESQKKTILDASIDRIRLIDKDMRIIWANKTTTRELNLAPKDLEGQLCYNIFFDRDAPCVGCPTKKALDAGNIEHSVMHQPISKGIEGETYWDNYSVPIKNESGDIVNLIQITRNITEAKRTEEALRESEERYRTITENANEAILVAQDGVFRFANPKAEELFGYSEEELASRPFTDFIHEADREMVGDRYERRVRGEELPATYPFRIVDKSRNTKWIELNVALFSWAERPATLCFMMDITDRKRTEEALRESEERLKSILDTVQTGIVIIDQKTHEIVDANLAAVKLIGAPIEDIIGHVCHKYYICPAEKGACPITDLGQKMDNSECILLKTNGEEVPIQKTVTPILLDGKECLLDSFVDLTEHKKAEESLRESEEFLRQVIDTSPDCIFVKDWDGKYILVNETIAKLYDTSKEQMVGKTDLELAGMDRLSREEAELFLADDREVISKQQSKLISEELFTQADGTTKRFQTVKVHLTTSLAPACMLGVATDITERKRLAEEREKLETQLHQAQKMEAIGTLAGGIAHDFNNILSPIMIHSEMAMMELPSDSPVQNSLKQIYKAGERAADLTKQILTFSRMRQQARSPLKVGLIVKECLKMLRASLPTTIEINQDLASESDTVLCDITEINQILMNLSINAAHAMRDKGGELTINLTEEHLDPEAAGKFPDLNPGSYLKLTVSDTGHGIDNETMKNIFEPYFTTKNVGEGTGMGLAVVHGIVRSYGGDITVESEPGKGTTFHVLLPAIESEASAPIEPSVKLPKGTERILFVDDEKAAVDVMQVMLERLGYKVTARTSSIEALEVFRHKAEAFDLVITDMTMPNMTGDELAQELMSIRSDIPIILCTGFSEKIDEKKAMHMGIRAFVMKPIVMRQIANTIREVLDMIGVKSTLDS